MSGVSKVFFQCVDRGAQAPLDEQPARVFVLTPKEIARVAMISPSGLTNRLTRLENMGHIERQMDPTDRRSSLVRLTSNGAKTADVAIERLSGEMNAVFHGLNKRDLEAFTRVIEALLGKVESKISQDSL